MKNNKGLTLVELIVTVAILSVIASGASFSINMLYGLDVKECTNYIYGNLRKTKVEAMSKNSAILEIYQGLDGEYYSNLSTETEDINIGKSTVKVSYIINDNNLLTEKEISESNPLKLTFNRSSGALITIDDTRGNLEKIIIEKGNKTSSIIFISETGRFYIQE